MESIIQKINFFEKNENCVFQILKYGFKFHFSFFFEI